MNDNNKINSNISENKQEIEIFQKEKEFSELVINSLPGIFYLYTYPENRLVLWNKQHEILLGYTSEEMKGRHATNWHLPKYKDAVLKAIDEVMEKGSNSTESTLIAKDGHQIPVFLTGVRFKIHDQLYFMGIGIDITEQKKTEGEMKRNETFLNKIIENIPDMIFVKDAKELRFMRFNKAGEELLGYSKNDLMGKNDYDFFSKEEADFFIKKDREVLHGKKTIDIPEEKIKTRYKGERILHTKKITILDDAGEPLYLLGISEDITERKRAEEEIKRKFEELEKMNKLMVGRELKMIELKKEIEELKGKFESGL